jgi:membrane protease YdiL (CAAX protease family)
MKRLSQFLHHRSLTVAVVALVLAFYALAFLPEHSYRLHQQRAAFLTQAAIAAALGVIWCVFTLCILLRDNRSGYPSFRCSVATLLWALACFPVLLLTLIVVGELWK